MNGAETKTVIVRCDSGVTFATGATINVGGIPVPSGNIATVVNRLTSIPLRTSILQNNGFVIFDVQPYIKLMLSLQCLFVVVLHV